MNYMKIENNTRKRGVERLKDREEKTKIQQLENYTRIKRYKELHEHDLESSKESYRQTNISGFNNSVIVEQRIVDEYESELKQIREIIKSVHAKDEVSGTYLALKCIGNLKRREIAEKLNVSIEDVNAMRKGAVKILDKIWPEGLYIAFKVRLHWQYDASKLH